MARKSLPKNMAASWVETKSALLSPQDTPDLLLTPSTGTALVSFWPVQNLTSGIMATGCDAPLFQYNLLSPESRRALIDSERRLDEIERASIILSGRELRQNHVMIRDELGHGHWYAWLKIRGMARTTASARIRAANWADEAAIVAALGAAALYRAAGAPTEVKEDIVQRLEAGETIRLDQVVERITQYREAERLRKISPEEIEKQEIKLSRKAARNRRLDEKHQQFVEEIKQQRVEVAIKLVAKLRTKFAENEIVAVVSMWNETNIIEIRQVLHEGGIEIPEWR